ncbi:MAG: folylpolyglutamate synthase/dihydrofolate synthase family protein [Acidimicrobiia bacterium]
MNYAEALAYLDEHINLERVTGNAPKQPPTLERMARLMSVIGDPQHAYPVVHITGTNGKGSTAQIVTRLLMAHGLTVGTITSPHLERVNERLSIDAVPITDDEFGEAIGAIADLEALAGVRPSYFEVITAAAYRWFADQAVDVAVVEVGMFGRWDSTNVADARVAVVTNVGVDHLDYLATTREEARAAIAYEKAGIVKPDCTLVLGETDPELAQIFKREGPALTIERDIDFAVTQNSLALGGRLLDIRTPQASYAEVFLPLHGAHQGDNAVLAITAVEAFFDAPIDPEVLETALAEVEWPGRLEVLGHQPLVVLDGAHNPAGAEVAMQALDDEFDVAGERIMVVGILQPHDPAELLDIFRVEDTKRVIACTPNWPRAIPAREIANIAESMGADATAVDDVRRACDRALAEAGPDDIVIVTGSLYTVGAARAHLIGRLHRR